LPLLTSIPIESIGAIAADTGTESVKVRPSRQTPFPAEEVSHDETLENIAV
jgi:hypothetical protein